MRNLSDPRNAYAVGYSHGLNNRQWFAGNYGTDSAAWVRWLAGWRAGQQQARAELGRAA